MSNISDTCAWYIYNRVALSHFEFEYNNDIIFVLVWERDYDAPVFSGNGGKYFVYFVATPRDSYLTGVQAYRNPKNSGEFYFNTFNRDLISEVIKGLLRGESR